MRWIGLVAAALTMAAAEGGAPRTAAEVKNVLVLQMGAGLDQYLASQLTRKGVVTVVQDPAKADAVFTDRIGPALRERLEEWREQMSPAPAGKQEEDTGWRKPSFAGISRGKGNYYLVDIHTYDVIWSFYHVPKSNQSGDLDRAAGRIASAFEEARKGKK
jgi:hypothetical protein